MAIISKLTMSLILILSSLFSTSHLMADTLLQGKSEGMTYRVEQVAQGLGIPWGMVFAEPEQLLITERGGTAQLLSLVTGKLQPLSGVPSVWSRGQGGLLDVALAPDYAHSGWIYFTYSQPKQDSGVTTLARAKIEGTTLLQWQDLFVTQSLSDTERHYGSRIAFDNQGHVFFSVGDRGVRANGQDLSTHAGSILRLNLDGSVPKDNPFFSKPKALPAIWSYGHRNPQGLVFDKQRERLWAIEHGPRGGDEINWILPGRNYGWAVVSHGKEYWGPVQVGEGKNKKGMEDPVKVYTPSIAPSSLLLYSGKAFPAWHRHLFAGALSLTHLNHVTMNRAGQVLSEARLLTELEERIRSLVESPEGFIYLATDSGKILRIIPTQE